MYSVLALNNDTRNPHAFVCTSSPPKTNIIRHIDTHQQTLQLILATITLEGYHKIWHTILGTRQHTAIPDPHSLILLDYGAHPRQHVYPSFVNNPLRDNGRHNLTTRYCMAYTGGPLPAGEVGNSSRITNDDTYLHGVMVLRFSTMDRSL